MQWHEQDSGAGSKAGLEVGGIVACVWALVCKFLVGALAGGFVSLVIFLVVISFGLDEFWESQWVSLFWVVPVTWGILATVWFQQMLSAAKWVFDELVGALGSRGI